MGLSIGIVGLPNVGKSTLFNALTKLAVPAENYPFCTIDPSVGIVPVPDLRLDALTKLSKSKKTIPAVIEFVDIAGLVAGASAGAGLGNTFLSHIREVDAIAHVVRVFEDADITHVSGSVDPMRDIGVINLELILADLETVTKRRGTLERDVKSGDKESRALFEAIEKIAPALEAGRMARTVSLTDAEQVLLRSLNLLSTKPMLYVLNKAAATDLAAPKLALMFAYLAESDSTWVAVNAGVEGELNSLEDAERKAFRAELGESSDGVTDLIKKSYELLGLITFLTTGEDETRAWTIRKGSTAPVAGAAIHTDFRDTFIRAQVISYEDLVAAGSIASAREQGLIRTEGKEYIVNNGDVIEFKI